MNAENCPEPPDDWKEALVDDSDKLQALAWLTVNCWPAMETMPDRATPVFCCVTSCTVPLPDPDWPDLMAIQGDPETVIQLQPAGAVTLAERSLSACTLNQHPAASEMLATNTPPLLTLWNVPDVVGNVVSALPVITVSPLLSIVTEDASELMPPRYVEKTGAEPELFNFIMKALLE